MARWALICWPLSTQVLRVLNSIGFAVFFASLIALPTRSWSQALSPSQSASSGVRVVALDGSETQGILVSATEQQVVLDDAGRMVNWPGKEIVRVEFSNPKNPAVEPLELSLVDGSKVRGQKLVGSEQAWQFADSSGAALQIGSGMIRSLLVRNVSGELAKAWSESLQQTSDSDSLILLRPGNATDRIDGIIVEVRANSVVLDLDGQVVDVPFEKLVGMIWFRKSQDRVKPAIEIQMTDGGVVYAETLRLERDRLEYRSLFGASAQLPLSRLSVLNYSYANLKWLYEISALESKKEKRMDWATSPATLDRALSPRFVSLIDEEPQGADFDLVFPVPGSYTFRVPDGFSRFQARVQRSDTGEKRSAISLEVWQDDQRIAQKQLSPQDDIADLDLPLVSGKKVRLAVVCESPLMIGTAVTWKQPRLVR